MTETTVLVLTDDELACIAAANRTPWALPLGPDRDEAARTTSALAGERSLVARGLVGRRDGRYALSTEAAPLLRAGLRGDPQAILFVADERFRWVLEGMSIAWYHDTDGGDVLETRSANGLHHFVSTDRERLLEALRGYIRGAYEVGFPNAHPGTSLTLCAVWPGARRAFRVTRGVAWTAPMADGRLDGLHWDEAAIDDVVTPFVAA